MNKIRIILLALLFNACQFNQSAHKDLSTGAYSRGDGLGSDNVQIEINGKIENRNSFVYREKVNLIFNDIKGLKKIDGKTYPGLSMHITNKDKDTVVSFRDLFYDLKEGTDLTPLQLNAHFVTTLPFGNDYSVKITIWDKKGDGTFNYEMPFDIEESKLLNIRAKNLKYTSVYFWNMKKKQPVLDKTISIKDRHILFFEKLEGLKSVDGKVYPLLSLEIEDSKGNKVISKENVLSKYETDGFDADKFSDGQIPVRVSFKEGKVFNPCTIKASLTDKNSSNRIVIEGEFIIE